MESYCGCGQACRQEILAALAVVFAGSCKSQAHLQLWRQLDCDRSACPQPHHAGNTLR